MIKKEDQWIAWLDELAEKEWFVADDFISEHEFQQIMSFFATAESEDRLRKAGIGAQDDFTVRSEIRGDFIHWIDEERDKELQFFFDVMNEFRSILRRHFFLNLSSSEFHIAKYPPGSHYDRHLDQFSERSNRMITVLLYLNEHWKPGDGGELKAYTKDGVLLIEPLARRLLVFRSDQLEHEVLTTRIPRYSLTGWLLHQPVGLEYLSQ